jgi:Na+-translocating ferredoxin:NAD+ oxidoreductase RnfC subunit
MGLVEQVRQAGVVGAGGGGFPTHVKISGRADTVIANGAECEPLLHKDAAVMESLAAELVRGVALAMEAVGAADGVVAIKAKNEHAVHAVSDACKGTPVRVKLLGDYYPAGDEFDLVHEVTGRLIPPAGIPLQVGAVVGNVETLVNVARASDGRPVTHKTLTIAGAVRRPVSLTVPLGTSYRDCIAAAGGLAAEDPVLCLGGMMMGETTDDLDTPVTKTSTGVIVLPRTHHVVERKLKPPKIQAAIGKSACDQCRYCTEYCPRFLLGYLVEPHQVMRSLAFTATGQEHWNDWAALCCSCGLCTLYACPEELFPKEACDNSKAAMRAAGRKWAGPQTVKPHPMREGRRVPIKSLVRKLHLQAYDVDAPLRPEPLEPGRVVLRLKQSAGSAAVPSVRAGDRVSAGQVVASPPAEALGALLHAPFDGRIEAVGDRALTLIRTA